MMQTSKSNYATAKRGYGTMETTNPNFCMAFSWTVGRNETNLLRINAGKPDGKPFSEYHLMGTGVPDLPSGGDN